MSEMGNVIVCQCGEVMTEGTDVCSKCGKSLPEFFGNS